jgi:hypothetical protein
MKSKVGWVISILVAGMLLFSASMKLKGGEDLAKGMAQMGLPENILLGIAITEAAVAILSLIPATAFFGVILITGYMGGAILTHARVGDIFITQILVGVFAWVGFGLRNYEDTMRLIRGPRAGR